MVLELQSASGSHSSGVPLALQSRLAPPEMSCASGMQLPLQSTNSQSSGVALPLQS